MPPLPHTITIQSPTEPTPDSYGGMRYDWADDLANIPANVQDASSSEVVRYAQRGLSVTRSIYITTDPGELTERHRVAWGGVYMSIVGVVELCNLGRVWRLDCSEFFDGI